MQLIKLMFWIIVTVIIAYFLTDIRVGGKTIKQNIDDFLASDQGEVVKEKLHDWLNEKLEPKHKPAAVPTEPTEPKTLTSIIKKEETKSVVKEAAPKTEKKEEKKPESIRPEDEKELKKVLKTFQ